MCLNKGTLTSPQSPKCIYLLKRNITIMQLPSTLHCVYFFAGEREENENAPGRIHLNAASFLETSIVCLTCKSHLGYSTIINDYVKYPCITFDSDTPN